jgi:signal peptidase I
VEKTQEPVEKPGLWSRYRDISREVHRGFIAEWTVTVILLLFATASLVQAFVIPSASMESSLLVGDHVLVDKLVRRGDIIVFRYPVDIKQDYVKRAVGLPGDHIRVVNKQLMLNGHFPQEPYVQHVTGYVDSYRDNFPSDPNTIVAPSAKDMLDNHVVNGDVVVPPDCVFAMGDNRDDSLDSRYWGFVPRENIEGTPLIIYWSYEASTADLTNGNIGIDHVFDVITHFFTKTRWGRAFKLIRGYPLQ